jgi:hypothetical protein
MKQVAGTLEAFFWGTCQRFDQDGLDIIRQPGTARIGPALNVGTKLRFGPEVGISP